MPRILGRKKGNTQPSPTWAYNLHGRSCISDSDTSSDEETTPEDKLAAISEDARLLRELDLSSRPDDAVFKANPWSIAKVNAASRPPATKSPAINRTRTKDLPKKKPYGRIVDAFKVQAAKPPSRSTSKKAVPKQPQQKKNDVQRAKASPHHLANLPSRPIVSELLRPKSGLLVERDDLIVSPIIHNPSKQYNTTPVVDLPEKAISFPKTSSRDDFDPHISRVGSLYENPPAPLDVPDLTGAEMSDSSLHLGPPSSEDTNFSEVTTAPSVICPPAHRRKMPINESSRVFRPNHRNAGRTFSGSLRSPQSSPLRQTSTFNYLPRIANSSPLRNDPKIRPLPALPLDKARPSFNHLLYQESYSHPDSVTSSFHPSQFNTPSPRLESVRPEEFISNPRAVTSSRRHHRDAYDAFPASPDSTWTSIPAPTKRPRPPAEKKSGNFKIARLVDRKSPEGAVGTTTDYSGSSKITTYLPPPRSEPKPLSDTQREPTRGVTLWNVKRMGHPAAYNSQKTRPDDIAPVRSIHSSHNRERQHEGELHIPFDSKNLGTRYKKVRQAARQ